MEEVEENIPKINHLSVEITEDNNLLSSIQLFYLIGCIVSIGPLHHGKNCLKPMEDQKWRYFNALLGREANTKSTLESCITSLRHSEQKARIFYGEKIEKESDQFIEMLLLDGCFIIELFLECSIKSLRRRDDPFFSSNEAIFNLICDLILYENQLPFFILEQLFHLVPIPTQSSMSLIDLSLRFFHKLILNDYSKFLHHQVLNSKPLHFLDLIRQYYLPTYPESPFKDRQTKQIKVHPATKIRALGIRIEKAFSESPSDITFLNQKLKIPSLEIHKYTEIMFRNLIAMELCQPKCSKQVTSYVILMEKLIQSQRDAGLLQYKDIVINCTDWEIMLLFKKLIVDIDIKDFYYIGICEKIYGFQSRREVCWQNMRDIYHISPFGIAGFSLAALFLVFLFTGALLSGFTFLLHHFQ
ncbi:hypothetical protein CDL12_14528 [Handroanthus impetiginosus]|uniref:DUF247 domain-containing protein n=1 Tax=Handroanthus impetiginosus TaxID=429701 RepID=A0A2G9H5T2_9LAMI|nr:hypothetical protein CDL12_14528 [Handroanthus impetiginosus]